MNSDSLSLSQSNKAFGLDLTGLWTSKAEVEALRAEMCFKQKKASGTSFSHLLSGAVAYSS